MHMSCPKMGVACESLMRLTDKFTECGSCAHLEELGLRAMSHPDGV